MMFFIVLLFVLFIVLIVKISKKTNEDAGRYYSVQYHDEDDLEDEILFHELENDDMEERTESSGFAYRNPYEMDPSDRIYLGEDGDILEDL